MRATPFFYLCNRCICSTGKTEMPNLPSHMDCSMSSRSRWECWLCIWLFPWWSKWQKAALGSPTVSRHGVCLLHSLVVVGFFLPPPVHSVMYSKPAIQSEMSLRLWIAFICEIGSTAPSGIAGQALSVAQQLPGSSREIHGFDRYWALGWCGVRINHSFQPAGPRCCCCSPFVIAHALWIQLVSRQSVSRRSDELILYSCCMCTNEGLSYWIWCVRGLQYNIRDESLGIIL